ncbi:hypothetical protein SUGI_0922150 [Cryptomeria japonica]|nr:hypothetical protein SUGI_0922150 [Cryptomeria japonica]
MANSDYSAIPNLQDIAFGYGFQLNQGERLELECSCCIEGESQIAGSTHLPHLIDVNDFGAHALHPCKHIQEEEKYQAVEEICNYFDGPGSDLLLDDSAKISDGGASDFIAKLVEKYNENLDSAWETEYFE